MYKLKRLFWNKLTRFLVSRPRYLLHTAFGAALKSSMKPTQVTLELLENCTVGKKGDKLVLPYDATILSILLSTGDWHPELVDNTKRLLTGDAYTLVDIGANVGLYSRQILESGISLSRVVCIEPDPINFSFLKQNLNKYSQSNIELVNAALSDKKSKTQLYIDPVNMGNYSLESGAMTEDVVTRDVQTEGVADFFTSRSWETDILFKSDTQGMDELIVSLIPQDVWNRVAYAVIEIWAIEKTHFDQAAFSEKLSGFKTMFFGDRQISDPTEVLNFIKLGNRASKDLVLIR